MDKGRGFSEPIQKWYLRMYHLDHLLFIELPKNEKEKDEVQRL